jgi:translation elongation factor EF-G
MDRLGCSLDTTLLSVKKRLKVQPVLINVPSSENNLKGLIDLPSMMHIDYTQDDMGKLVSFE